MSGGWMSLKEARDQEGQTMLKETMKDLKTPKV